MHRLTLFQPFDQKTTTLLTKSNEAYTNVHQFSFTFVLYILPQYEALSLIIFMYVTFNLNDPFCVVNKNCSFYSIRYVCVSNALN